MNGGLQTGFSGIISEGTASKHGVLENGETRMNKDVEGLVYGASLVSIITAIYLFATGKKDTGVFVGLWAPTFLGMGTFYNSVTRTNSDA